MRIGVGGNIGSGKTSVVRELIKLYKKDNIKVKLIDADQTAWTLYELDSSLYKKILEEFGKNILDKQCQIDRKKLGQIVFSNGKKLNKLNRLIHPALINKIKTELHKKNYSVAVIDAALLFFWGDKIPVDIRILITAPVIQMIARMKKRGYNPKEIKERLSKQMKESEMEKTADFVINNKDSITELRKKTKKIYSLLKILSANEKFV